MLCLKNLETGVSKSFEFSRDVKEGFLRGLESVPYHPDFADSIARWFLSESEDQVKRLLLMRMLRLVEADMYHEETYYNVITDEFSRGMSEHQVIKDCLAMWKNSRFVIVDNKLIPLFDRKIKQYSGFSFDTSSYLHMIEGGNNSMMMHKRKKYDVFISHAVRDKIDYVDSLYDTIKNLGIEVFYDSVTISWGDNWKDVIMQGTENSEFAIIVISENFFGRDWTEKELREFLNQQNERGQKIILPLLHGVSRADLKAHYPDLGYIQCINSSDYSKEMVALLLAKELIKRYK